MGNKTQDVTIWNEDGSSSVGIEQDSQSLQYDINAKSRLWLWDASNTLWRKSICDNTGKLIVSNIPAPDTNSIHLYNAVNSGRTFPLTILTYTVPTGKTLYIQNYHLQALGNGTAMGLLKVETAKIMIYENPAGMGLQQFNFGTGVVKVLAGQTVYVIADTGSSNSKTYIASVNGVEV